jgi:hypothetical protein
MPVAPTRAERRRVRRWCPVTETRSTRNNGTDRNWHNERDRDLGTTLVATSPADTAREPRRAICKAVQIRSRGLRLSKLDEKKSGKAEKQCFERRETTEHTNLQVKETLERSMHDQAHTNKSRVNQVSRFKCPMDVVEATGNSGHRGTIYTQSPGGRASAAACGK